MNTLVQTLVLSLLVLIPAARGYRLDHPDAQGDRLSAALEQSCAKGVSAPTGITAEIHAIFLKESKAETPAKRAEEAAVRITALDDHLRKRAAQSAPVAKDVAAGRPSAAIVSAFREGYINDRQGRPREALPYPDQCVAVGRFPGAQGGQLSFIGSPHVAGTPPREKNGEKDEVYRTIQNEVAWAKPSVIVVEGVPTSLGVSPCELATRYLLMTDQEIENEGEEAFSVREAIRRGIPFIGGEPEEQDKIRFLVGKKRDSKFYPELAVSDRDAAIFLAFECLAGEGFPPPEMRTEKAMAEKFASCLYRDPGPDPKWDEFLIWYFDHHLSGEPGGPKRTPTEKRKAARDHFLSAPTASIIPETGPIESADPAKTPFSNRLSILATEFRNSHLHRLLHALGAESRKVMVVYGQGHLEMLKGALAISLGKPSFVRIAGSACKPPEPPRPTPATH